MSSTPEPAAEPRHISHDELVREIARGGVTLVDALPIDDYVSGHLPGAISIPLADLEKRAPSALPNRDAPIVTYCGSYTCPVGAQAARLLESMGYTDVRDYHGGVQSWQEHGLALETDRSKRRRETNAS